MLLDFSKPVSRVVSVGRLEGVSYILLLAVAMPLDRLAGIHLAIKIAGWTHGILFILLALVTFIAWRGRHLSFKQSSLVAIGALLPFGPFIVERWLPGRPRLGEPVDLPDEITRGLFLDWRDARYGTDAAEDMTNPYWCWLIREKEEISSWSVNEHFRGPSSYKHVCEGGAPLWSADRLGQSEAELPDGRRVLIAGEHEDSYDPDFFIYNDLTIIHPDGRMEILGYPTDVFPPTDFHTSTLVDGKLVVIGNLGHREFSTHGSTQVLIIDPETWEVRQQTTTGECPGWIHKHEAELRGRSLVITKGLVNTGEDLIENFDDWQLDLDSWTWSRLTERKISIYDFEREDGEDDHLSDMWMWSMNDDIGIDVLEGQEEFLQNIPKSMREEMAEMMEHRQPKDVDAFKALYEPSAIPHTKLEPSDEESLQTHIEVEGVKVRYIPGTIQGLRMIVEGELPKATAEALVADLLDKLHRAEGAPFVSKQVRP